MMMWLFYQTDEDHGDYLVYIRALTDNEWLNDRVRSEIRDRIIKEITDRTGKETEAHYHASNGPVRYETTTYLREDGTTDVYHRCKRII